MTCKQRQDDEMLFLPACTQLRDAALGFRGRPHLHKAHLQPVPQPCPIMLLATVISPLSVLSMVVSMPSRSACAGAETSTLDPGMQVAAQVSMLQQAGQQHI